MSNILAFPKSPVYDNGYERSGEEFGMNLRDYHAAAALTGLLAQGGSVTYNSEGYRQLANRAYTIAQAMVESRDGWEAKTP